jgi:hypothetical protein
VHQTEGMEICPGPGGVQKTVQGLCSVKVNRRPPSLCVCPPQGASTLLELPGAHGEGTACGDCDHAVLSREDDTKGLQRVTSLIGNIQNRRIQRSKVNLWETGEGDKATIQGDGFFVG